MQQENIIVNSCELTPVYLIPSTSVSQAGSFIITQNGQDVQNPVADNLKTFYENSGNLENGILSSPKPRILKKVNPSIVGNNLKLASFLLPKTESVNVQNGNITSLPSISTIYPKKLVAPVNNVVMKNGVTAMPISSVSAVVHHEDGSLPTKPLVEIDRKIVRVGPIPNTKGKNHHPKVLPKNKPNEKLDPNVTKHTSVQLIKLGETYHSLNQLSEEQLKIVNKALKMFSNNEQEIKEPAYDPITNTKFIYKVVSPKDLAVVGKNKVNVKMKNELKKQKHLKVELKNKDSVSAPVMIKKSELKKQNNCYTTKPVKSEITIKPKNIIKQQKINITDELDAIKPGAVAIKRKNGITKQKTFNSVVSKDLEKEENECSRPKVTRSGRTVRLPKHVRPGVSPQKPKKKVDNITNCFQCSAEFSSFYRLTRHYEKYPTHIPTRIHCNLFHCLLAIIKGGSQDDQANIFVQQLEQLIEKLKSLWPCLLKGIDGTNNKLYTLGDDLCRLFDMNPGQYSLNIEALNCIKDKDGHCIHNPALKLDVDESISTHTLSLKRKEEIMNIEADTKGCARINSVDKWPMVTKRIWKLKQKKENLNAKKIRLTSENDHLIEPGTEDCIKVAETISLEQAEQQISTEELRSPVKNKIVKPKTQTQFHSAHFDIRSSPIKLPSSLVRRFQLNPDKACNFEVQVMRPIAQYKDMDNTQTQSNCDFQNVLNAVQLPKETTINTDISFETTKEWSMSCTNDVTEDDYIKTDLLLESGHKPEKNTTLIGSSLLHVNNSLETPHKTRNLIEATILQINNQTNNLIHHDFPNVNGKTDKLFQTQSNVIDKPNGLYDHESLHVERKCNSSIGTTEISINTDETFESALSHVKERSNNLFDTSLLEATHKSVNLIHKHNDNLFNHSLTHDKTETDSLIDTSMIGKIDKVLVEPPMLQDDNTNLFASRISQRKRDGLLNQGLDNKLNCFGDSFKVKGLANIDLSANESRLMTNQGQSMLNFLDSVGLGYPETEFRNNAVDFHMDLFSFHTS